MPMLLQTIDQIMHAAQRDMYFIRFGGGFLDFDDERDPRPRAEHLAWFDAHGLSYEMAAPRGWLSGDPGCFAVYFTGHDDPRVAAYSAQFETPDGHSRDPDAYRMVWMSYQSWFDAGGPGRLTEGDDNADNEDDAAP